MNTDNHDNGIRNLLNKVKQMTVERTKGLNMDTAVSRPVPIIIDNQMYLRYFFYDSPVVKVNSNNSGVSEIMQRISAPSKWVQFNFLTCEFVLESNFDTSISRDAQYAFFPDKPEIKSLSQDAYTNLLNKFENAYIQGILEYFQSNLSESKRTENTSKENFNKLFELLTPDILKPFYKNLNPGFTDWLKK